MKQSDNRIHLQDTAVHSTNHDVVVVERELVECTDPVELARKVRLAFKRLPGEAALACFAKLITADLPHLLKVAVWDAVRYSHIWWGVDEVLKGDVMTHSLVQQAFADAVPMRRWLITNQRPGSYILDTVTEPAECEHRRIYHSCCYTNAQQLVGAIVKWEDSEAADYIRAKNGILNADTHFARDEKFSRAFVRFWPKTLIKKRKLQRGMIKCKKEYYDK